MSKPKTKTTETREEAPPTSAQLIEAVATEAVATEAVATEPVEAGRPMIQEKIHPMENLAIKLALSRAETAKIMAESTAKDVRLAMAEMFIKYRLQAGDTINTDDGSITRHELHA